MGTIEEKVKAIIVSHLKVNPDKVTKSALIVDDLGADSLDTIEIIMAVEEGFDEEITDEEAETLVSLGAICTLLEEKKS